MAEGSEESPRQSIATRTRAAAFGAFLGLRNNLCFRYTPGPWWKSSRFFRIGNPWLVKKFKQFELAWLAVSSSGVRELHQSHAATFLRLDPSRTTEIIEPNGRVERICLS